MEPMARCPNSGSTWLRRIESSRARVDTSSGRASSTSAAYGPNNFFPAWGSTKVPRIRMDRSSAEKSLASLRVWKVFDRSLTSPGRR